VAGFKALRDKIPQIVGECVSDETHDPQSGNTVQQTTGGLLVWRQADNWTVFTNGITTWLNGPTGLVSRPNGGPLFAWEMSAPASTPVTAASSPAAVTQPTSPPAAPASSAPAAAASAPALALDQLVLSADDFGEKPKDTDTKKGSDSRASWYEIIYRTERNPQSSRVKGPQVTVNRVYRAKDEATARQLFEEQAATQATSLPEAKQLKIDYSSLGPQAMNAIGDDLRAVGACGDCNEEDKLTRHYRVVLRVGSIVETLYTYGIEGGNNPNVVFSLAEKLERRIASGPAAPLPELLSSRQPSEIGLQHADAGKEAVQMFSNSGSDERASWYEARFERGEETIGMKLGPTIIYNKIFVAASAEQARAIYKENATRSLPESTQRHYGIFIESKTKSFGNESYAVGACNVNCDLKDFDRLHERLVYRWGNVVVLVYIWGHNDESNPAVISRYGELIAERIP
jgi:hypothetical protein